MAGLLETLRAEAQDFIRMALYDIAVAFAEAQSHMYNIYMSNHLNTSMTYVYVDMFSDS